MTTTHKVQSSVECKYVFYLPIGRNTYYRHIIDSGIWRHHSKVQDKNTLGGYVFAKAIVKNILDSLFGRDNKHFIHDVIHQDIPQWVFSVDVDTCPYTQQSIEVALQVLTDMLHNDADFKSDPYDPVVKFNVPTLMLDALRTK